MLTRTGGCVSDLLLLMMQGVWAAGADRIGGCVSDLTLLKMQGVWAGGVDSHRWVCQ